MPVMKITKLNKKNFEKFGNIIKTDENFCIAKFENFKYYLIDEMGSGSGTTIGLLEAIKKIDGTGQFERHHFTEEVIMPLKGEALIHLAEPDKLSLTVDDITTFKIEPGYGIKLFKDVWHTIPVIESNKTFLCLILKNKTEKEDLYFTECK
jgi:ureidoglycolate hydrolase